MSRAFSKILILVILAALIAGGIFAWQYFRIPKEEGKVPGVAEETVPDETTKESADFFDENKKIKLEYKMEKGMILRYRVTTVLEQKMSLQDFIEEFMKEDEEEIPEEVVAETKITMWYAKKIADVTPEGVMTIEEIVDDVDVSINSNIEDIEDVEVIEESAVDKAKEMLKAFSFSPGEKFSLKVSKTGEVLSQTWGGEEIPKEFAMGVKGGFFPEKEVGIGDSWIHDVKTLLDSILHTVYTLEGFEKVKGYNCVKITSVTEEIGGLSEKFAEELKTETSGTIYFAYKEGVLVKSEQIVNVISKSEIGDVSTEMEMKTKAAEELLFEDEYTARETIKKKEFVYPDDYILKPDEIPSGFQLKPIDEEARKMGFTTNPGFFNNIELYKELYGSVDTSKIENLYASFYIKTGEPVFDLGVLVVKYKSEETLNSELEKIKANRLEDAVYLKNNNILVMVWSDANSYMNEVRQIANKLKMRLNLQKI